jgi:hypothetical protein
MRKIQSFFNFELANSSIQQEAITNEKAPSAISQIVDFSFTAGGLKLFYGESLRARQT